MSDRFSGLVVTFDHDISEEHIIALTNAIKLMGSVIDVSPLSNDPMLYVAQVRAKHRLLHKILELFQEEKE